MGIRIVPKRTKRANLTVILRDYYVMCAVSVRVPPEIKKLCANSEQQTQACPHGALGVPPKFASDMRSNRSKYERISNENKYA